MYNIFKYNRSHNEEKARATATPWKKKDKKKKLDVSAHHESPREIHLKPLVPSKPKEIVAILPSTPRCQAPRPPYRRDSYSTITTIDDLEAASSSCVQSQVTELSDRIPNFISFVSFPDEEEQEEDESTISARNMPLIQKPNKYLPDFSNVGYFYGDDDFNASLEFTMPNYPANTHTRKSPKQLLNQMDSSTHKHRGRDGRPALRRGESMGLNALSPPLRQGTLSPSLRSTNRGGRGRVNRLEI